jgi:AcrR family transcriptional regulator
MMPASNPPTARGQQTRARILAAAEKVFGEQSFEHASIIDITREAGVAQGTFYVYFPSKHAVFAELVDSLGRQLRRALSEAVDGVEPRLAAERAGLDAFLGFVRDHRHLYRIVRQAEFVDAELYRAYYRRFAEGYRKGLQAAMRRGEIVTRDPEAIAYALMGIFDFLGMRWVLWEDKMPPTKVLDDVYDFITHGLAKA